MNWPSPKDFSDALRKPAAAFADPDLAAGDTVVGLDGRPLPRRGDSAEVYQVCADDDRSWAVKCFTRPARGLADRYARLREVIDPAVLPFAVRFDYLPEGVRVGGHGWPVLKMDWVEGLLLHQAAGQQAGNPAALDGLFQCWVRLARQLRAAGIAHGDLQHGNVVLVPGGAPGSFHVKLIDYDGVYIPTLANHPSGETGHPNYQHPARVPTRAYSADLDRFPLLVIGTALKGLSLLGRSLWERYDTGDNLLFTRDAFLNPAGSAVLRELCQTGDPVVRALVGHLTLACRNPISATPWLDELVGGDGRAQLPAEQSRAVVRALGLGPKNGEPVDAIPLELGPEPLDAEPVDAEPVDALPLAEEEQANERPRSRKKRPKPPPARPFPLVPAAVVAGLLMIAGAAVAGVLTAGGPQPDETAQVNPNDPARPPALASPVSGDDTPPAKPAPVTPPEKPPIVPPAPPAPPAAPGPPGFHRVWAKPVADQRGFTRVFFAHDGRWVFATEPGSRVAVFDAKTGAAGPVFRGPGLPTVPIGVWTLDRDRVAVYGIPPRGPGLWDVRTGVPLPDLVRSDLVLPPPGPGVTGNAPECQVSADGRYIFAGYHGFVRGLAFDPAPYRVVDTTTGRVAVSGDWQSGSVRFTADGSRMLMAETNGRVRWVKLPGGEEEIAWAFQPNLFSRTITGMSADGSLVLYYGKPPGLTLGHYLLDGKTGQPLRKLDFAFSPERTVLSADGRRVAGVVYEAGARRFAAVITDARTGAELVRTPIEGSLNDILRAAFTPDGKSFVLHHRADRELMVFELRGEVPPVPPGTPVPPPLGPVPDRLPPGAMVAVAPQVRPVPPVIPAPPPLPPAPVAPDAPPIKPRLTVVTDAGVMANQLPQAPLYSRDGKTLILSGGQAGTILTFDAKTGAAGPVCEVFKGPGGIHWLAPVGNDRIASYGFDGKHATWDIKTGKRVAEGTEVKYPELPPLPVGALGHAGMTFAASPTGRYTVAARKETVRPVVPGPLRVLDTTTGKVVVTAGWNTSQGRGFVGFTADESRVFVLDGLGKATWYKLPSGGPDGEWRTGGEGIQAEMARVLGMTADGRRVVYTGPLGGQQFGTLLLDGKTGQAQKNLHTLPQAARWSALSPDGRFLVLSAPDLGRRPVAWYTDVYDTATWQRVGRLIPPEKGVRDAAHIGFSPDGKEVAVFHPTTKELSVFPLPGGGAQLVGPPAPPELVRPQPPAPAGPPELKTRWTAPIGPNRKAGVLRYEPVSGKAVLTDPAAQSAVVYDGNTGQRAADQPEGVRWASGGDLFPLAGGKIGFHYRADAAISVWNLKDGKPGDPIPVPDIPPGPDRTNHRFVRASPDGKFLAVARYGTPKVPAPFRVFDAKTGKAVVSADWTGGSVYFTADSARVLVAEADRCRWFKLPSGEPDGEWKPARGRAGPAPRVTDVSADGRRVGYNCPGGGPGWAAVAVLDGQTGKMARAFGDGYLLSSPVSLSADGRLAAAIRQPAPDGNSFGIDVIEVDTGRVVGRATVPTGGGIVPHFFLTPDGKGLLVHNPAAGKVHWFDLPANPDIVPPKGVEPNRPPPRVNPPVRPGIGLKPVQLAPRWVANPTSGDTVSNIHYDPDARLVLLSNPITRRSCAIDAGTGNEQPDRIAGLKDVAGGDLFALTRGRVGVFNRQDESITVWDVKGNRADDPIPVPDIPAGPEKHNYRHARLSPDGKFLAVGRRGLGPSPEPLPLRVFDTATRKAVLSLDWTGGSVYFTADSARVLVAEAGRCRWFKLPSGEPDGEWQVPKSVRLDGPVTAISADGRLVGYSGTPVGPDRSPVAVLDGKTGGVLRGFGEEYQYSSPVSLSADGRLAAVMRKPPGFGSEFTVDVVAVADGRVIGRVTVETRQRSVPTFRLTPDGGALLIHDYNGRKLYWYDLPQEK